MTNQNNYCILNQHTFGSHIQPYHRIFIDAPDYIGLPTYWENDPESPHLYGTAIDINVIDWNESGEIDDEDWQMLAAVFEENELVVDQTLGRPNHVHAYLDIPPPEPMIEISITPETVEPGWDTDYRPQAQNRQFTFSGRLLFSPPYNGYVTLRVNEVSYSGGHHAVGRPMNHLPNPQHVTQFEPDGTFAGITYEDVCQWGGLIQIRTTYLDGGNSFCGADTALITFNYLFVLGENPSIRDTGQSLVHPFNQYIDIDNEPRMFDIVERFHFKIDSANPGAELPIVFTNDISLPDGGRFTICLPWWDCEHHSAHRQGAQADVFYSGWVYQSQKWEFMWSAIIEATGNVPLSHYGTHFHILFPRRLWAP